MNGTSVTYDKASAIMVLFEQGNPVTAILDIMVIVFDVLP
jgi:hypothetical protein